MKLNLVPLDRAYFSLLSEAAANLDEAAQLLVCLMADLTDVKAKAHRMLELEHVGDKIVHDIVKRLNKTFVTPLDRQDIYDLAATLDDVLDSIEAAADMLLLYRIEAPTRQASELGAVIAAQTILLKTAIDNLECRGALDHQWIEVHRLENEGDRLYRDAVAELFEGEMTDAEIIKWKDIYATLEQACDGCEDVANVIETVVMKES